MKETAGLIRTFIPWLPYPYMGCDEACSVCGDGRTATLASIDRRLKKLTTVICRGCGLIRTNPMPTDSELDAYYTYGYRADYQFSKKTPPRYHLYRSAKEAQARTHFLASVLGCGTRVLDVGAGSGEFVHEVQKRGGIPIGIEPGQTYASFAVDSYGVDVRATLLSDQSFPTSRF